LSVPARSSALRECLRKTYPSGDRTLAVLQGADFSISAGETVSIRGESGSGKSTLLNILAGLDRADSGELFWGAEAAHKLSLGELTARRGRFLGLVFQSYYLIPGARRLRERPDGRAHDRRRSARRSSARAEALLKRVGLAERATHLPTQLSGGERQRVAVARALMNRPRVILADEPTGNLDERTGEEVISLLLEVCAEEQAALVLVTHNPAHAARCTRHLMLRVGSFA
jgi:lipoprotein-releasing system ATP-binding protein